MRVEFVGPIEQYNPDFDLADVFLHLDDGRTFAFDVATPNYIYWCMDNEGLDHYVGIRPVLVKRLTPEIVERALKAVVDAGKETLNAYGVLTGEHDEKLQLTLGKDEALILFELFTDFFDEPAVVVKTTLIGWLSAASEGHWTRRWSNRSWTTTRSGWTPGSG